MPTITPKAEPAVVSGLIVSAVGSGAAVAVAFGAPLTEEQTTAILGAIPAWVALIMAASVFLRSQVTPNASVVERAVGKDVIAGEANELPTGKKIRGDLGDGPAYEPRRAAD